MKKMLELGCVVAFGMVILLTAGCGILNGDTGESIKTAIVQYAENDGKEKAIEYIDKMVADGKLGAANAEKLKSALADGIDKLKEELEKEGVK